MNLTRANRELYRRSADERFSSPAALSQHCARQREQSRDHWEPPQSVRPLVREGRFTLTMNGDRPYNLNDWSFSQMCRLAGISKSTVNRLTPETAVSVFEETMPSADKPLQILTAGDAVRSVHGVSYTRLWNTELLAVAQEFATDFQPPQEASGGGTGLYCGEQDMFCFLIDPTGWAEIEDEAFAPGFFLWNSEVGKRSVGVQTFWFQALCQNHIVWDAVEVIDFSRKHTANVHDSLREIRRIIAGLVEKRDQRRDEFVEVLRKAMATTLGSDADEAIKTLTKHGIGRTLAKRALDVAKQRGRFTIFAVVDALTRIAGELKNAGERTEADTKASQLLALAV